MLIKNVCNNAARFTRIYLKICVIKDFFDRSNTYSFIKKNPVVRPTKKDNTIEISYEKKFENIILVPIFARAAAPPAIKNFKICLIKTSLF